MVNPFSLTRRHFIALAATTPVAYLLARQARPRPDSKPNIIFIMADDLGYADLSCYGRRDYSTPNIDRLATEGMRFTQAYSNSPVCSATRTALITGRYQYRLPVGLEEPINGARNVGLPAQHPTLPSLLRKAGYATSLIGKWHLGSLPDFSPLKSGYDRFWGFRSGAVDYFKHSDALWNGDAKVQEVGYLTDLLGNHTIEAIDSYAKEARPFFISLHFNAPHWPWEGPGDAAEAQRVTELINFDGGSLKTYAQMVRQMDLQVGRIMKALDTNRIADNTLVIFTSDNGGERFSDTWPFTGKKTELLEGGVRIPAIARWRGRIPAGKVSEQVAISMDWLPTLLQIAGSQPDAAYMPDGMSLAPALTQNAAPTRRRLFWRYKFNAQEALRDGDMKYLKIAGNTFLFDLAADPLERANLKDKRPDVFKKLTSDYAAWNATMLPIDPASFAHALFGSQLADHYGNNPRQ